MLFLLSAVSLFFLSAVVLDSLSMNRTTSTDPLARYYAVVLFTPMAELLSDSACPAFARYILDPELVRAEIVTYNWGGWIELTTGEAEALA
ncbi:hypothetical protein VTO42DRAFT_6506 [Malbranchea cinnamomea]